MTASRLVPRMAFAGALAALIFVSPALSSRGPDHRIHGPATGPASGSTPRATAPATRRANASRPRPSKPAVDTRVAAGDCTKVRRSLFVEGEGWIVRRVSVCR